MVDRGHSWQVVSFVPLGASVRGFSAYTESGGTSLGNATSRSTPVQMIVDVRGEGESVAQWHGVLQTWSVTLAGIHSCG